MATVASTPRSTTVTLATVSAGPFNVGFRLFDADGLAVFKNGVRTTAFTVSATFSNGYTDSATITLNSAAAIGDVIRIDGDMTPKRDLDYVNPDPSLTKKLNIELARLWASVSEVAMQAGRSLRLASDTDPFTPADTATIIWDAALGRFKPGPTSTEISNAQGYASAAATSATNANTAKGAAEAARDEARLYDGPKVDTFAELAGITPSQLAVGAYVRVIETGAVYQRVSSGGHLDYSGSGGVRLNVLPGAAGYSAAAFGVVVDDGTVDNATALEKWRDAIVASGAGGIMPQRAGTVYSSRAIEWPHTGSYYRVDTGVKIIGGGPQQFLTRKVTSASKFSATAAAGVVIAPGQGCVSQRGDFHINATGSSITLTGATATTCASDGLTLALAQAAAESFFAIYGSNYTFSDLHYRDCAIGQIETQKPGEAELSHTSFNTLEKIFVSNCSFGIVRRGSSGAYYSAMRDCHVFQCQIGFDFGSYEVVPTHNHNRNAYTNIRAARCQVGIYLRHGDTNTFTACHTESCGAAPTNNRYSAPAGLPSGQTTWAVINSGTKNVFVSCVDEASTNKLYSNDVEAIYIATRYAENVQDNTQTVYAQPARLIQTDYTTWLNSGALSILSNTNANLSSGRPAGLFAPGTLRLGSAVPIRVASDVLGTNRYGALEQYFDLGAVASGGAAAFSLWTNTTAGEEAGVNAAAVFDVDVLGDAVAANLAHNTKFRVIARRNSSRTLVRYHVLDVVGGRATGAAAGDSTEAFTPALTDVSGALTCTLTAPARAFDRVLVTVRARFVRP